MANLKARMVVSRHARLAAILSAALLVALPALACSVGGSTTSGGTGSTATATSTATPTSPPQPPNIAGSYIGYYTNNGSSGSSPMGIQISQSGATLSGSTNEFGAVYNDTGHIDASGAFTIMETANGGVAYLHGTPSSSGHLSGAWDRGAGALGTWDVYASISGSYNGFFTNNGQAGNRPMQVQITQTVATLSGTTNESGAIANDTGVIDASGRITITEHFSGGSTYYLHCTLVGPGHLSGAWDAGASTLGTWDVQK